MGTFTTQNSVTINASPDKVYAYIADLQRHVEWNHQPQAIMPLTEGPVRVGSRYETDEATPSNSPLMQRIMFAVMSPIINRMYGSNGHTFAEITVLEENQRVSWQAHLPTKRKGDLMRMNWDIRLTEIEGGTQVTQRAEACPPESSPFYKIVNDDLKAQITQEIGSNLGQLKAFVETNGAQ